MEEPRTSHPIREDASGTSDPKGDPARAGSGVAHGGDGSDSRPEDHASSKSNRGSKPGGDSTDGSAPIFICDASAEAERLLTTLRNHGYSTVDVPFGMLPTRVRYELPSLIICDADAHEALRLIREMREATTTTIPLLFVGHDDGALRHEAEFREMATATLTRPLNLNATLELIESVIGSAPSTPSRKPAKTTRRGRAPLLVASTRKPFRSDSGPSTAPPSELSALAFSEPRPTSPVPGSRAPLPIDSGAPATEAASSQPSRFTSFPPSSAPAQLGLSTETQALLEEGRQRMATLSLPMGPSTAEPHRRTDEGTTVDSALLDILKEPLDLDEPLTPRAPSRQGSAASARTGGSPSAAGVMPSAAEHDAPASDSSAASSPGPTSRDESTSSSDNETASQHEASSPSSSKAPSAATAASPTTPTNTSEPSNTDGSPVAEGSLTGFQPAFTGDDEVTNPGGQRGFDSHPSFTGDDELTNPGGQRPTDAQRAVALGEEDDLTLPPGTAELDAPELDSAFPAGSAPPDAATIPPPFRGTADQLAADDQTNPGGRPASVPSEPGILRIPTIPPTGKRSLESIAARPLMSTPPPLDDLSDLLAPGSSRMPASVPIVAPTPPPPSLRSTDARLAAASERGAAGDTTPGETTTPQSSKKPSLLPPDPGSPDTAWVPRRTVAALGLAIRQRRSGSLAQQASGGVRRIILRDGDILTVTSSCEEETLTHFLHERGDLSADDIAALGPVPRFGRHAGAALIARGHLRQEELWPVLRSHAEWILARMMCNEAPIHLEDNVPARVSEEPAVFGGAAGAEIYMEVLQRALSPKAAFEALGSGELRLGFGQNQGMLAEAALIPMIEERAIAAIEQDLAKLMEEDASLSVVLLGLIELGILTTGGTPRPAPPPPQIAERSAEIDDEAFAARVKARRALVDDGDYFAILGVARSATSYELDRAHDDLHRELSVTALTLRTAHLASDIELILTIVDEAHMVLHDDVRRERYRRALEDVPA